jgi:hypothetical protein
LREVLLHRQVEMSRAGLVLRPSRMGVPMRARRAIRSG